MNKINEPIDLAQFYTDFLTKGMVVFDGTALLKDFKFEPFEQLSAMFPDGVLRKDAYEVDLKPTPEQLPALDGLAQAIKSTELFGERDIVKYHFADYRVNHDVLKWHNDAANCFEQHNATINCFFDDMDECTGGRFDVMRWRSDTTLTRRDHPDMTSVYPKRFMIVVFNQNRNFMHKVQHSMHLRRMLSFAAGFSGFNELTTERENNAL